MPRPPKPAIAGLHDLNGPSWPHAWCAPGTCWAGVRGAWGLRKRARDGICGPCHSPPPIGAPRRASPLLAGGRPCRREGAPWALLLLQCLALRPPRQQPAETPPPPASAYTAAAAATPFSPCINPRIACHNETGATAQVCRSRNNCASTLVAEKCHESFRCVCLVVADSGLGMEAVAQRAQRAQRRRRRHQRIRGTGAPAEFVFVLPMLAGCPRVFGHMVGCCAKSQCDRS